MTDILAEINAKEKCQEQLNIIFKNAQILSGDMSIYTTAYQTQLQNEIDNAWSECCKIAISMIGFKNLPMPKPMDTTAMTDAGIIPSIEPISEVSIANLTTA